MPEKKVRILITAFDTDKGDFAYNVSKETVAKLAEYYNLLPEQVEIVTHVFPVSFKGADKRIDEVLNATNPDYVICLGQTWGEANEPPGIDYETRAVNARRASELYRLKSITPNGPKVRRGFYDANIVPGDKVKAYESDDGGYFLCNHLYYRTQEWMKAHGKENDVTFLHLTWPEGKPTPEERLPKKTYEANLREFPEAYAAHVFELALAAAGVVEVQRAAKDAANPYRPLFAPGALENPQKTSIAALQYQLVRLGFLQASTESPTPIDGILDTQTIEAIRRFEPAPGMLLDITGIDLPQAMIQVRDYEKRMAQAVLQFKAGLDTTPREGETALEPRPPTTPNILLPQRSALQP